MNVYLLVFETYIYLRISSKPLLPSREYPETSMLRAFAQREGFAKPLPNPSCTSQNCPLEVGHKMKELQERLGRSMGEVE